MEEPEVSLNGSPTASLVTEALCGINNDMVAID